MNFLDKIKSYFLPKGIQLEMLRYRPNKISYMFGLLAAIFLAVGFCCFYSGTEIVVNVNKEFNLLGLKNAGICEGIDIVINILSMLFLFLAAIRMEFYSKSLGIASICMGAFAILRVFLLPLSLLTQGSMNSVIFTLVLIFYVLSGACSIIAGFLSIYRGASLRKYLETVKPIENEKVVK